MEASFLASLVTYLWTRRASGSSPAQHWTSSDHFYQWLCKLIERTAVSEATQLLALNLVMRLTKKTGIAGMPGSEYRMILVALGIANKLLEDNTFTARTWSDVSGIDIEAFSFGEREVLKGLGWRILPSALEWTEWKGQVNGYRQKRQEALTLIISAPSTPIFDPGYSMSPVTYAPLTPHPRSLPGSPVLQYTRKRKVEDAGLGHHLLLEERPMSVARRSSAGQLQRQAPGRYQTALQQGILRSASLSPIAACSPYAGSPVPTPYSTPPAVFSPVTYGYLTTQMASPAMTVNQSVLYHTVLTTDPLTGRITTQLVAAPLLCAPVTPIWPPTPRSSLGSLGGTPPPPH